MPLKGNDPIVLVGAGLAGSLLSIFLARRGYRVEIYERRPDMRKGAIRAGRSINLAISTRGIYALEQLELWKRISEKAIPMRGRMIHAPDGTLTLQRYGKDDTEVIRSISRRDLNVSLLDAAEETGRVKIHFERRCTGMDLAAGTLSFVNERDQSALSVSAHPVIGTDGSASPLRVALCSHLGVTCGEEQLSHGYKELTIPPGPKGAFRMEKNALHIWPRKSFMLIALPNLDGSYTATLFLPWKGEFGFDRLPAPTDVRRFFGEYFPDALDLMPGLEEEFFAHPTGAMVTIKARPWHVEGKLLLLGDAAHAIVPFFGQGMNCAFEDCTVLDEILSDRNDNWERAFRTFEAQRKENADAIADMAAENFVEMRDHTADPRFHLKKKVERLLEERFPGRFIPKYSLVTFHRVPYSEAKRRGARQEELLHELCREIDRLEQVDLQKAEELIRDGILS